MPARFKPPLGPGGGQEVGTDTVGLIWDCPKPSDLIQIIAIIPLPLLTSLPSLPSFPPFLPSLPTFLPAAHASFLHPTSTPTRNEAALAPPPPLHRRTVNDRSQQILESLFLSAPIYVALDHLSVAKVTAADIIPGSVVYTGKDVARTRLCSI